MVKRTQDPQYLESERKSDVRDALVLARLGWADRDLLNPIVHGGEKAQHDLLQIKLLDHVIIGAPTEGRLPYFSFKEAGVL